MRRPAGIRALVAAMIALPLIALGPIAPAGGQAASPSTAPARREPPRFSHAAHLGRGVDVASCAACHTSLPDGRAAPPTSANPHQPCASAGCHEAEFFSRKPTICGVCHDAAEPSTKQLARYAPRARSEFGGEISHRSHATAGAAAGGAIAGANGACVACHGDVFRAGPAPSGHTVCGACHATNAKPAMATCGGCHLSGAAGKPARAAPSAWAVAARFRHGTHASDPTRGGAEAACGSCHAGIEKAERAAQIAAPTMGSCDSCHDGKAAFKTTGFECAKCHGATP